LRKINIEDQSKKKGEMVLSILVLLLGLLLVLPVVTNYQVTLMTAFALGLLLTFVIAIASILEDVIDNLVTTKGISGFAEIVIVIIFAIIVLSYLGPIIGVTTSTSVQAWMIIITLVADRVSKLLGKAVTKTLKL